MMAYLRKTEPDSGYRYSIIQEPDSPGLEHRQAPWRGRRRKSLALAFAATLIIVLLHVFISHQYVSPCELPLRNQH